MAIFIYLSSQSLNILSLIEREYVPESRYKEIREFVLAKPLIKYAIDSVAARFVFEYKLPKNSTDWICLKSPLLNLSTSAKDKQPDVTWIVSTTYLGNNAPEMLEEDYPRIEFFGWKFNSLPKKPFDSQPFPEGRDGKKDKFSKQAPLLTKQTHPPSSPHPKNTPTKHCLSNLGLYLPTSVALNIGRSNYKPFKLLSMTKQLLEYIM